MKICSKSQRWIYLRGLFAGVSVGLSAMIIYSSAAIGGQRYATSDLNEFDVGSYCYGAENHYSPEASIATPSNKVELTTSRFGYISSPARQELPRFVYITAGYYVHLSPYGDPGGCEFKRHLYYLAEDSSFSDQDVDEDQFVKIMNELHSNERIFERANPGKVLGGSKLGAADSIGGCLFPIRWYAVGGRNYALLSVAREGVIDYVIPQYERVLGGEPSACSAWGGRHLTNSSIVSGSLRLLSLESNRVFVELSKYQKGFVFEVGPDFQCVTAQDAFAYHILVSKDLFDTEIRPVLEEYYRKKVVAGSAGKESVVSFVDSVLLNREFAISVASVAKGKGCK